MKTVLVRYKVKPEFADENQRLIEQVFAQLAWEKPAGLRYQSFRLADGVSFVHVASREGADDSPLLKLKAFRPSSPGSRTAAWKHRCRRRWRRSGDTTRSKYGQSRLDESVGRRGGRPIGHDLNR
jgi:hypothetical protein